MDFTFNDEQEMMAGVVRDLLADVCDSAKLRKMLESGAGFDADRWAALADLGLFTLLVPEDKGGLGLTETDFIRIATACGAAMLPEPLVDLAGVTLPLLAELDVAFDEGEIVLWADRAPANQADRAARLLVTAPDGSLHLVARDQADLRAEPHVDPFLRLFTVTADLSGATRIAAADHPALIRARQRGALFAAAQMLGLAQTSIDLGVAYAAERKQFGKPIGSYQALKHHMASAQVKVEFARPVLWAAATDISGDTFAAARVSHALLVAGEAADYAARQSIQVHGGMGYSWEVDVHFCLKRALYLTYAAGSPAQHRNIVAARAFSLPLGPANLFASEV